MQQQEDSQLHEDLVLIIGNIAAAHIIMLQSYLVSIIQYQAVRLQYVCVNQQPVRVLLSCV